MSAAQGRSLRGEFPFTRMTFLHVILLALATTAAATALRAQEADVQLASYAPEPYTAEELDNLLAPVALYPDPILAQVLVAATFPEQVELAAQYLRTYGASRIDEQPWDISVRAVAHYAPVLNLMADRIDWTTALGQAHATQPGDVMTSVQTLREMARAQGNLVSTAQQKVVVEDRTIYIVPAQPQVVYVPTYDPVVIYHRPVVHVGVYRSGWSFGIGFPVGVWLNYDFDWHRRHVYYHGWHDFRHSHHRHWYGRSRPYIVVNNIYVNRRHTTVVINRRVVQRRVHYDRMDRYNTVHRRVSWDRRREHEVRRQVGGRDDRGPSWDRNGNRPGGRYASERRVAANQPSRPVGRSSDGPSWDRSRRNEAGTGGAPRGAPRAAPGARPQTTNPVPRRNATPQRTISSRVDAAREVARVTPRPRPQPQRTLPQRTQPQRTQPQRTQPQRAQPQRVQTQRTLPQRTATPRVQPQRAAERSAPRAAPSRASSGGRASAPSAGKGNGGRAAQPKASGSRRGVQ